MQMSYKTSYLDKTLTYLARNMLHHFRFGFKPLFMSFKISYNFEFAMISF